MTMPRRTTGTIDCTCTPHREHGDQHVYQTHRCGCDTCCAGYQRYLAERQEALDMGRGSNVDARPVAARLVSLSASGVSMKALAEQLGCSQSSLHQIRRLERARCRRWLARKVMSVPVP